MIQFHIDIMICWICCWTVFGSTSPSSGQMGEQFFVSVLFCKLNSRPRAANMVATSACTTCVKVQWLHVYLAAPTRKQQNTTSTTAIRVKNQLTNCCGSPCFVFLTSQNLPETTVFIFYHGICLTSALIDYCGEIVFDFKLAARCLHTLLVSCRTQTHGLP